ncbi:hypothetical protein CDD83_7121 [Cordyceps sp. RAO-2017]|nr:hypothetical protein CDD83_7121 [Cordyceps sp. RAO-2017]
MRASTAALAGARPNRRRLGAKDCSYGHCKKAMVCLDGIGVELRPREVPEPQLRRHIHPACRPLSCRTESFGLALLSEGASLSACPSSSAAASPWRARPTATRSTSFDALRLQFAAATVGDRLSFSLLAAREHATVLAQMLAAPSPPPSTTLP